MRIKPKTASPSIGGIILSISCGVAFAIRIKRRSATTEIMQ
jgi:hypothetical protein